MFFRMRQLKANFITPSKSEMKSVLVTVLYHKTYKSTNKGIVSKANYLISRTKKDS